LKILVKNVGETNAILAYYSPATFSFNFSYFLAYKYALQENGGGDHSAVGLQLVNPENTDDLPPADSINYLYAQEKWFLKSADTHQQTILYFHYNFTTPTGYNGEVDENGEIPAERRNWPVYRLQFCGDNNHCRTTSNMGHTIWLPGWSNRDSQGFNLIPL